MAQTVAGGIQLGIAELAIQATDRNTLRMRRDLCFEQFNVAFIQRVIVVALVAALDQECALLLTDQCQFAHVTVEAFDQRQQQALELAEHVLHGGFVEITLVVRQVQAQVIARIADGRQRIVGVGATGIRGGIEALRTVEHRDFHRRVFEHEQAVEQRLALGQFAVFLNSHQRQVFVLAQLHVAVQQLA